MNGKGVVTVGIALVSVGLVTIVHFSGLASASNDDASKGVNVLLRKLRQSPELLGEMIGAKEGSVEHRAITEFLETPAGKAALFRLFLKELSSNGWGRTRASPMPLISKHVREELSVILQPDCTIFQHNGFESFRIEDGGPKRKALYELLGTLEGAEFTAPGWPGWRFVFIKLRRPYRACDGWREPRSSGPLYRGPETQELKGGYYRCRIRWAIPRPPYWN